MLVDQLIIPPMNNLPHHPFVDEKRRHKPRRNRKSFIKSRNHQSEQQCILIALLNLKFDILLEKPRKINTESLSFFKVLELIDGRNRINLKTLTDTKVQSLIKENQINGIDEKTIKRRLEVYKIMEHIHVLLDIAQSVGYKIKTNYGKRTTLRDNRLLESFEIDGLEVNNIDLDSRGRIIHEVLVNYSSQTSSGYSFIIKKENPKLQSILFKEFL
ncbi:hypothetical protein ENU1_082290 [Entamoeba nuttalli P19]|uniref:Uncharacterized protein n=1 Tax=Entamoeba nuttalli (strain P19) TaxID=1076696 RepID=K2GDS9_ENTNP|nr:hypothetical protein ENU1_082290 [Entamoeba nuttalli P19]EKE40696.1 hypothetical protein ENU1_082290 [Entamoeba nuttalli P19]|eukprot:XP_008856970.1 hypothetical protein ENU1_082290 [Entamoeba nuttalli P19]